MHRIIYSLELDLGVDADGQLLGLIVPLDRRGHSPRVRPRDKRRAVDLRVGDSFRFQDRWHRVLGIRAYRENQIAELAGVDQREDGTREDGCGDGWVVG